MADLNCNTATRENTIVTACNRSYFWGAFLLIASIRYSGGKLPVIVLGHRLTDFQKRALSQFENVSMFSTSNPNPHLSKAEALAHATTEYITWLDADCMYVGNIDHLLVPREGELQIRLRGSQENQDVFKRFGHGNDNQGDIPKKILAQWRNDINERLNPRYLKQCVTNSFCFHRSSLNFFLDWQKQINLVSPAASRPVNQSNKAYFMTDESVLASMLCFSHRVPTLARYNLDHTEREHLMHFGMNLKPWVSWREEHLKYYDYIQAVLGWVSKESYQVPRLPISLNKRFRAYTFALARFNHVKNRARNLIIFAAKPFIESF